MLRRGSIVNELLDTDLAIDRGIEFPGKRSFNEAAEKNYLSPLSLSSLRIHVPPSFADEKYSGSGRQRNCNKYNVVSWKDPRTRFRRSRDECDARFATK